MGKKVYKKVERSKYWIPEDGEYLEGVIVRKDIPVNTRYGEASSIEIETEEGERVKVLLSTQLYSLMENVPTGADIRITYAGVENNPKTKRTYKAYTLEVAEAE